MVSRLEDHDAVDKLVSQPYDDHLTPTQPDRLQLPSGPSRHLLPDYYASPQPNRLRLPSPPPTKTTKNQSPPPSPHSDTTSSLSSASSSSVSSPTTPEAPSPLSPSDLTALLTRIHSGISYTATQHTFNLPITQTTRFSLSPLSPSHLPALSLLRKHATLISSSPTHELYELGIPRPDWVREGAISGVHDAQWWMGKNRAEIKAGPFADEADVRMAEARIRGVETKRRKRKGVSGGEREREWKLRDGVRRAEGKGEENMEDIEEEDEEDEGEEMEGVEYGNSEPSTTSPRHLRSQSGSESSPSSRRLRSRKI